MPAVACDRCGRKDFSVNPQASGLCDLCLRDREAKRREELDRES